MLIFYKLARNTFVECVREPVYFLMLACALCINGLFPTAAMFVFRDRMFYYNFFSSLLCLVDIRIYAGNIPVHNSDSQQTRTCVLSCLNP